MTRKSLTLMNYFIAFGETFMTYFAQLIEISADMQESM